MKPRPPKFTATDAERAHDEWGANCGPAALAAVTGLTLDEVRPHMRDFEGKGHTNPSMMFSALRSIGVNHEITRRGRDRHAVDWPDYGLARIQWEGPWTRPGVPIKARYRQTHWVGACRMCPPLQIGIFDINALGNGSGWCSVEDWAGTIVPFILETCVPKADGRWHITHAIEIQRKAA